MVILKEKKKKQEGTVTLQQALDLMADTFSRGVVIVYQSKMMNFKVFARWFDYDPESSKPIIQASFKDYGELVVYPEQVKKIEHYISGFRFTLADGATIETHRN